MCATPVATSPLHGQGPAAQHAPLFETQRQALRLRQGHHGVGVCLRRRHVSAALGQDGGTELCIRQAGGMLQLPGQGQRLLTPLPGLVRIAQPPRICAIQERMETPG